MLCGRWLLVQAARKSSIFVKNKYKKNYGTRPSIHTDIHTYRTNKRLGSYRLQAHHCSSAASCRRNALLSSTSPLFLLLLLFPYGGSDAAAAPAAGVDRAAARDRAVGHGRRASTAAVARAAPAVVVAAYRRVCVRRKERERGPKTVRRLTAGVCVKQRQLGILSCGIAV